MTEYGWHCSNSVRFEARNGVIIATEKCARDLWHDDCIFPKRKMAETAFLALLHTEWCKERCFCVLTERGECGNNVSGWFHENYYRKQRSGGINNLFNATENGVSTVFILTFYQTMSEIGTLSLERLNNGAHFLFFSNVLARAEADANVKSKLCAQIVSLKAAMSKRTRTWKSRKKSMLTDDIATADASRTMPSTQRCNLTRKRDTSDY